MRIDILREVFLKELRETLRDRRSLAVMFGIPLLVYPLLMLAVAGLGVSTQRRLSRQVARVALVNPDAAPHLVALMEHPRSGVELVPSGDPRGDLLRGKLSAILRVPPGFEPGAVERREGEIRVQVDRSHSDATFTEDKVDRLLRDYERWIVEQRLRRRGMPASLVAPLRRATEDLAPADRRLGSLLSLLLPMMLLIGGVLGSFFPAINAATTERELGTLESLLVTPASKMELLVGKAGLVMLSGLVTAALNLLSMSLVLWRSFSLMARSPASLSMDPRALALSYLATVPTILFFAALCLVVALMARNYREVNAYATPVILLAQLPVLVGIAEPRVTPALLVTPAINSALIIREVLTGHATAGAFLLAFVSSCFYAALMFSLAARVFTTEDLVNPSWEPVSIRGLRSAARAKRRLPGADEALALYALSLVLLLYVSPEWSKHGFLGLLAGNELLLILAPTLLFAALGRWRWRETFAWRRPEARQVGGGILLGIGLLPWVFALGSLQDRFWPRDPATARATMELVLPALQRYPVLTIVAVGLLAGICEELLYRGPIQAALARRLPPWVALAIGGLLFAAAHMDAHGLLTRALLGVVLGWVVLRGGSIFPAMALHAAFDSAAVAFQAWELRLAGAAAPGSVLPESSSAALSLLGTPGCIAVLLAGAAMTCAGWALCRPARPVPALRPHPAPQPAE